MSAVAFDTLAYAKRLEAAGVDARVAEAQAQALAEILKGAVGELSTKRDIEELRAATKRDIEELRTATKRDIEELRTATKADIEGLRHEMKEMESRITLRLGGLIVAGVGVLAVLMRIL